MNETKPSEGASEIIYLRSHLEGLKESQLRSERLIEKLSESVIALSDKMQQVAEAQIRLMSDSKYINDDVDEMKLNLAKSSAKVATLEAKTITLSAKMDLLIWLFGGICVLLGIGVTAWATWTIGQ